MPTEAERLTAVETRLANVEEVVLRMDTKLDVWRSDYVPRQEIQEMFRARDLEIRDLKSAQNQRSVTLPQWIMVICSGSSVIVALVVAFHGGGKP